MSTFAYVGRNRQGAVKKGELTAKTRDEAVDQLRKQQVVVTSLEEKSGMGGKFKFSLGSGLTDKDLVVFTRQFGTMINAGLPLIQCLDILSTQSENKVLRETVGDVKNSVEAGSTFSDALKRHPKVFDDLYVNMIHAGEVGGLLDTILTRLAKHIEKAMKLKGICCGHEYAPTCDAQGDGGRTEGRSPLGSPRSQAEMDAQGSAECSTRRA